jgi:hypothetical protein
MEYLVYLSTFLAPFIPFLAMVPPSLAAVWIADKWLKTRRTSSETQGELAALRNEVAALRQFQAEAQERLDFSDRLLTQLREGQRALPRDAS